VKGRSRLITAQINIIIISAELQLNKYTINFKILSKTRLPSSTAATMVEKSSFDNIISAACFVISVPLNPIATPTSAAFIAEVWANNSSSTYPFGPYPPKSAKTYEEHSLDPALFNDPSMKLTPATTPAATTTATPANYYGQSPIGLAQHEPVNYAMDKPQTLSPNVPSPQDMMTTFNSKTISSTPKRYKCEVCQKRFTRPSSLQTHMYSHTGEKLDGCGRHFSVVSNLRRHQKIHGNNNNDGDSSPNVTN
ncbi:3647_t:CDS:2, partial [Entrophospora sp. SA101]